MILEPVLEAMQRNRRAELFAKRLGLPVADAMRELAQSLKALHRFHRREPPRATVLEILRQAGARRPVMLFNALCFYGFLEGRQTRQGTRYAVDVAPARLCVVQPPLPPGERERRVLTTVLAWLDWRLAKGRT